MTTRFPRLRELFGEVPEPATERAIQRLIDAKTPEHFDLDFKGRLYDDPESRGLAPADKAYDLPSDVAAMANSGGGAIVLGVEAPQPAGGSEWPRTCFLQSATG
jgi:hypothetical protein